VLAGPVHVPGSPGRQVGSKWYNPVTITDQVPGMAVDALVIVRVEANGPGAPGATEPKVKDVGNTLAVRPVAVALGPRVATERA
jgi:hypothetical protein